MSQKVLVLDLTHGGEVLAKEYRSSGAEVTTVDVYRTAAPGLRAELEAEGVRVLDTAPAEDFDLAVVPVHCPDRFLGGARCREVITHHQAVGRLARFPFPVIEFTGARGKTSACHVLAHMLQARGDRVLLHTSRGLALLSDGDRKVLRTRVNIAPAWVLALAKEEYDADVAVIEVSLGGTGVGDVSVITTIGDNYAIAGETRRAFDGKVQMVELAKGNVVFPESERGLWQPHVPQSLGMTTFGPGGDVDVELPERMQLGRPTKMNVVSKERSFQVKLPGTFLVASYHTAFSSALAAACSLGIDLKDAAASLEGFDGVPGRGEVSRERNGFSIRERNPGVSASSIAWNLRVLQEVYGQEDIGLVLDPVNQKVCEKLDLEEVEKVVSSCRAVKGAYIINMPGILGGSGFRRVEGFHEVRGSHRTMVYCTKEGYR
jgi:UDP-N-acetylmuramyl pentapeptide synthase